MKPLRDGGAQLPALDGLATLCRDCHIAVHAPRELGPLASAWRELVHELTPERPGPRG